MEQGAAATNKLGFTDVAEGLSTPEKAIRRQQVYMWWKRRDRNGFPEGELVQVTETSHRRVFDVAEVRAWYVSYKPSTGGRPTKHAA